jgi:rSAM/selenodomain-associated transferase 2
MTLSIVMPVLDEAAGIADTLQALAPLRRRGAEVIVVDGGSRDGTAELAEPFVDAVIAAPRGRAAQMNAGAAVAHGDVLLFLHADTQLPDDADTLIADGLARSGRVWGRFDVAIPGSGLLAVVAAAMNLRSRLTGIATGDQAMFITRTAFHTAGGFPPLALMEDIAMSGRLLRIGRPLRLRAKAVTSARRWQKNGIVRTVLLMWRLRLAFRFGADPRTLAIRYGYVPRDS